jgi:hypothetical protein
MFLVGPKVFSFVEKGVKVIFWEVQRGYYRILWESSQNYGVYLYYIIERTKFQELKYMEKSKQPKPLPKLS